MKPPFPTGTIDRFFPNTPHFFLSNFYPASVVYDGVTYITVEHAYQAAKSLDPVTRTLIAAQPTAARAKRQGGALALREGWDQIKFNIMEELLFQKFTPNSPLALKLLGTGDVQLIEGNYWHDLVWGQCFCARHKWEGSNRLGGSLMHVRGELKVTCQPTSTSLF